MSERLEPVKIEAQYSPLGERGKKIISEWNEFKRRVGGLEGQMFLDLKKKGKSLDQVEKEIENLRPIRKALIDEYNADRAK